MKIYALIDNLPFLYKDGRFFRCEITLTGIETGAVDLSKKASDVYGYYTDVEVINLFMKPKGLTILSSLDRETPSTEELKELVADVPVEEKKTTIKTKKR